MLARFLRLSAADRLLVLRVIPLVAAIRTALWLLPFGLLRSLLRRRVVVRVFPALEMPVTRLAWAVHAASRAVPCATCLTQSLALQFLLRQLGHPALLQIGVARHDRQFVAHAWIECGGQILLDDPDEVARYRLLTSLSST
jgi:hypothetical protein